jgi:hypothetical protein
MIAMRKKSMPPAVESHRPGIVVDADGNETGGPWQHGLFYAQPPVAYHFGGTVPGYDPRQVRPDDQMQARFAYDQEEQANQALLKQAVFDLSQTGYGRQLLSKAHEARTEIVFDKRSLDMRNADALADYGANKVLVQPGATRQEMVLNLAHELRHFELDDGGKGPRMTYKSSLAAAFSIVQAKEGDARAVGEGIVAVQASRMQPGEDSRTYKPKGVLDRFATHYPVMGAAAKGAASLVDQGNLAGFAAAVFPAFYQEHATRAAYMRSVMSDFTAHAPRRTDSFVGSSDIQRQRERLAGFMVSDAGGSHAELAPMLPVNGVAYLGPKFSLDSPAARQLSSDPAIRAQYAAFRADMAQLAEGSGHSPKTDVLLEAPPARPSLWQRFFKTVGTDAPPPAKQDGAASFPVIVMPSSNGPHHAGDARPVLANLHRELSRSFAGASPVEALSSALFSIQGRTNHARSTAQIETLVDAGLRAPMAAFPQDYLSHLTRRVKDASEVKDHGKTSGIFTSGEDKLIRHWQDMQRKGIDPVFGVAAGKPASHAAIPGNDIVFANALVGVMTRLSSQATATPTMMAVSDMVAALPANDMAPRPHATAPAVKSRPTSRR